jgi:peptidoglycan/xylan/chitin deacetylase (PgdA/CDA1 family)
VRRFGRRQLLALGGGAALGTAFTGATARTGRAGSEEATLQEVDNPKRGGQQIVWSVSTDEPIAALTFDDGPTPELTPRILEILERYGVVASFMMVGHCAESHPTLVREVVAAGHDVGNHSWRHLNLASASAHDTRLEIEVGAEKIEEASRRSVTMFRPPRGRLSEAALRILAPLPQDIVMWSVSRGALDWEAPARVASNVVDGVGPGDIVDLHDGIGRYVFDPGSARARELLDRRLVELEALPRIIEGIQEKGVRLVGLSELLPQSAATPPKPL